MTARPIFPESRRRPVRIAVALMLVLVAVLLAAGCIGGDVTHEQDLTIIKINHDGSMAWMKTIDSGKDDEITDVIQTFDGGYAIPGGFSNVACNRASHFPTTPKIIRLSEKGDIVWEREYTSELKDKYGYENSIKGIIQTMDSGFYIISQRGMILKTNPSGIPGNKPLDDKVIHDNNEVWYPELILHI
jgi:hypothetical protein